VGIVKHLLISIFRSVSICLLLVAYLVKIDCWWLCVYNSFKIRDVRYARDLNASHPNRGAHFFKNTESQRGFFFVEISGSDFQAAGCHQRVDITQLNRKCA